MLVTDKIIFLRLQKTACTHIEKILLEHFNAVQMKHKHHRIPIDYQLRGRHVVGGVRNPLDWYISFWSYGCQGEGGPFHRTTRRLNLLRTILDHRVRKYVGISTLFKCLPNMVQTELNRDRQLWIDLYSNVENIDNFRKWLKIVLNSNKGNELFQDYTCSQIKPFVGLYTYLYLFLYSKDITPLYEKNQITSINHLIQFDKMNNMLDYTIRNEHLENDLVRCLNNSGHVVTNEFFPTIKKMGKTNTSERKRNIDYYYDNDTRELVKKKDLLIFDKYNYLQS